MKTIPSAVLVLVLLTAFNGESGDVKKPGPGAWNFVDYFPKMFTYTYLGRTSDGRFRFKPVGGTVEIWTPEITLGTGEASDGGYLKVIRSVERGVEVQASPVEGRIQLEINHKISAMTIFIGFQPKKRDGSDRPFFVEIGEHFTLPNSDTEFIVTEADSKTLKVVRTDGSSEEPITFQRSPGNSPLIEGARGTAPP
jgi:hypothetical protein